MPTTDPTAYLGNMSEASVNRFAEKPWWAAVARPINTTASQRLPVIGAKITGTTQSAQVSNAVLRAAPTDQPRFISHELCQPPATDPTSAIRYTVIIGLPISLMSTLNNSFINLGNQNK